VTEFFRRWASLVALVAVATLALSQHPAWPEHAWAAVVLVFFIALSVYLWREVRRAQLESRRWRALGGARAPHRGWLATLAQGAVFGALMLPVFLWSMSREPGGVAALRLLTAVAVTALSAVVYALLSRVTQRPPKHPPDRRESRR
jgi:hypothetical protein